MMDPEDIAGRLHPDGAPGTAEAVYRSQMGDKNYEAWVEHGATLRSIEARRLTALADQAEALAKRERYRAELVDCAGYIAGLILAAMILVFAVGAPALTAWLWGLR